MVRALLAVALLTACGGDWDAGTGEVLEDRAVLTLNTAWPTTGPDLPLPRQRLGGSYFCGLVMLTGSGVEFEVRKPSDRIGTGCGYPPGSMATVRFIIQRGEPLLLALFFDEEARW